MSQIETNRAVRMLTSKPLKFTIRVQRKDGSVIEIQSDHPCKTDFNVETRSLLLVTKVSGEYGSEYPICDWSAVDYVQMEENPKS
jgi:hypothetical protein